MSPTDILSDTEQLVLSYLSTHAPEDCMLDKISLGTGKSRATVLKYLGMLHAKGILEYQIIGRNKLWHVRQAPREKFSGPPGTEVPDETVSDMVVECDRLPLDPFRVMI